MGRVRLYKKAGISRYVSGRAMFPLTLRISRRLASHIPSTTARTGTQAAGMATPSPCKYQADQEPEISFT